MSDLTGPPPPSSSPPEINDFNATTSPSPGWSIHSTNVDGVDRYFIYSSIRKESRWVMPTTTSEGNSGRTIKEPWQRKQEALIAKYYDKAKGGFGPQKLADDPRYKHITKKD